MRLNSADERAARDRALFDRIAAEYSRKDSFPASRVARQARLRQTLQGVGLGSDMEVLEVGCGAGFSATYLAGSYRAYVGIDYSAELIRHARSLPQPDGATFVASDLFELPTDQKYDLIFMIGVLHHLADIPAALTRCRALLRSGGWLAVNEPQPANPLFHALRKLRTRVDAAYSDEQEELREAQLLALFRDAGFAEVRSAAQGLFSTPFAEVVIPPQRLTAPLSRLACKVDRILEQRLNRPLKRLSWNIVVTGRQP